MRVLFDFLGKLIKGAPPDEEEYSFHEREMMERATRAALMGTHKYGHLKRMDKLKKVHTKLVLTAALNRPNNTGLWMWRE